MSGPAPDRPPRRRVVVTGMGCVTPLGVDTATSWRRLIAGESAAGPVTVFPTEGCRVRQAAEVDLAQLPSVRDCSATTSRRSRHSAKGRATALAIPAAREALAQAGLLHPETGASTKARLPLIASSTAGGMAQGEAFLQSAAFDHGQARKEACRQVGRLAGYQAQQQALDLQAAFLFTGPVFLIANACASGANAIGHAADLISLGLEDIALTGGWEALTRLVYVGFDCLQALSPGRCQPFDVNRTGLLLGEGAAFLVLESEEHARARGATILAELRGYGHSTDLHHTTQPQPEGVALQSALRSAFAWSGSEAIPRAEIGYINAHGTGTKLNDGAEAHALSTFFAEDWPRTHLSSTKAAIGHTLGAAGAIEAVFTLQALRTGALPPQLYIETPEPAAEAALIGTTALKGPPLRAALSVNLGFGGSNAALLFTQLPSEEERA